MSLKFLDFEQPIAELQAQIEELKAVGAKGDFDISLEEEIGKLQGKREQLIEKIFGDLGAWQVAQLARHQCVRIRWTTSNISSLILMSLRVTARSRMIVPLSAVPLALMANPS